MAKALTGLVKYETGKGAIIGLAGANEPYFIAELHFEAMDAIKSAFASELGRRLAADRRDLAPEDADVQMFLFDEQMV